METSAPFCHTAQTSLIFTEHSTVCELMWAKVGFYSLCWCKMQNEKKIVSLPLELYYLHTSFALLIDDSVDVLSLSLYGLRHKTADTVPATQQVLKKYQLPFPYYRDPDILIYLVSLW